MDLFKGTDGGGGLPWGSPPPRGVGSGGGSPDGMVKARAAHAKLASEAREEVDERKRITGRLGWEPVNEKPLHDAIVDTMIANPGLNCVQLGALFGYGAASMRLILRSDLVREKLAKKREDLVDPILRVTLEDRFTAMLEVGLAVATQQIATTQDGELALKGVDVASRALGFGAKPQGSQQQLVIINPGIAPSSEAWASVYGPQAPGPGSLSETECRPGPVPEGSDHAQAST